MPCILVSQLNMRPSPLNLTVVLTPSNDRKDKAPAEPLSLMKHNLGNSVSTPKELNFLSSVGLEPGHPGPRELVTATFPWGQTVWKISFTVEELLGNWEATTTPSQMDSFWRMPHLKPQLTITVNNNSFICDTTGDFVLFSRIPK